MKISFDITDQEADIIAIQHGHDGVSDKTEFVIEQFKKFGRSILESQALQVAYANEKIKTQQAVDAAKDAISF